MTNPDEKSVKPKRVRKPAKGRRRTASMVSVSVRIPLVVWQKLEWEGEKRGLDRPALMRLALTDAVRHTKPPVRAQTDGIPGSEDQWREWEPLVEKYKTSIPEIAAALLTAHARKLKPPADE